MNTRRNLARFGALSTAAAAAALCFASPASAHVTIDASTTAAGSYSVLTVSVPHGCEESSTTKVEIKIPEPILSVTPTRNPFWDVTMTMEQLDEPVEDSHGNEVTERVGTVVYTAKTPLAHDQRDAFELSLQLPDDDGTTLAFPAVQTCEEGETAWVEVPSGGQSSDDLEHPAPTVTITAAEADSAHGAASDAGADADHAAESSATKPDRTGIIGMVAGLAGLALGAAALVQVRRRS